MTSDEIRKLLGGYATNTLTETERQALFEAALEDQELFNALHQEQALKELLADPVSRAQIRQALEERPSIPWWSRWWLWTGAMSAVAATVLIVAVTRSRTPEPMQQYASVRTPNPAESDAKAAPQPAASQMAQRAPGTAEKSSVRARPSRYRNERKDELPSTSPPVATPAPTAPPPQREVPVSPQVQAEAQAARPSAVPSESRSGDTQAQSQQSAGQAVTSLRDQERSQTSAARLGGAVGGALSNANIAPLSYTLLKRNPSGAFQPLSPDAGLKPGDSVRLSVAPIASGYLSLSRQDAPGQWTRVFPETGPGLSVSVNARYTIPTSPIAVTNADQTLRLTLIPTSMLGISSNFQTKAKTAQLKKESTPNPALFVDLTIGPKSVP